MGTSAHPVTKMLAVSADQIWCSVHNCVKIIDTAALEIEASLSFISQPKHTDMHVKKSKDRLRDPAL